MGIGYVDSVIIYNRHIDGVLETETYYGTRFDGVRVELTQGNQIATTGNQNADACIVKIPAAVTGGKYLPPKQWEERQDKTGTFTIDKDNKDFYVIVRKPLLGIDIDLPVGAVESEAYPAGFFQYVSNKYGYAYQISTVDVYELIPRFQIGGK